MNLLDLALEAHWLGLCVMPPREDGSKGPAGDWKAYQEQISSEEEIRAWYSQERSGIGLICGRTSGYLEIMEFEGRAVAEGIWNEYKTSAEAIGLTSLLERVSRGYGVRSPSGGIHLAWRCPDGIAGNTKLAERPATPEELAQDPNEKRKTLIETRGEGGFIICPPSNGRVHPTGGAYSWLAGGFDSIVTIGGEERQALLELARSFDRIPREEYQPTSRTRNEEADSPGNDFNLRGDWHQILEGAGWSYTGRHGGREHWYRKGGGRRGWTSATITPDDQYLYVFSTSTELPSQEAISKWRAYAFLYHDGDFSAAASQLRADGYGGREAEPVIVEAKPVISTAQSTNGTSHPPDLNWPEPPSDEIYHGLAGRLTTLIDPYVESDQVATLVQFLASFGVAVGLHPHFMVGPTRHDPSLYIGLVGRTSRARKGTSWDPIEALFTHADPEFVSRIMSGVGSGERVVWLVRDPTKDKEGKVTEEGAPDRRLLLQEPELARLLTVVNREGSTMSAYLRQAYDGKALRNEVKTQPSTASLHRIGLIGHCTTEELQDKLRETQIRNGLANRIAWFLARRAKKLSDPPLFEGRDIDDAVAELRVKLLAARSVRQLRRSKPAQRLWDRWYDELPEEDAGIVGAVSSRAEAQVIRLAMIYALTDVSETVELDHLRAAIALWEFSTRCVSHIFGATTGDIIADRVLKELEHGPLTRTELSIEVFCRNISSVQLEGAARLLERRGLLVRDRVTSSGRGRPAELWRRA